MSPTKQLKKLIGKWRKAISSLSSLWQKVRNLPKWISAKFHNQSEEENLAAIVLLLILASCFLWGWLRANGDSEPHSTTIRDITLTIVAAIGLVLAYRRVRSLDIQATAAHEGLINERYQKGAEMLDSKTMATRIGGIYALKRLAQDHPEGYHIQVMEVLCTFIRYPVEELTDNEKLPDHICELQADIQEALYVIGKRSEEGLVLEKGEDYAPYLRHARLKYALLSHGHLEGAYLNSTDLSHASITHTNLRGASLSGAILTGADLTNARGLTQKQLDEAVIVSGGSPPNLEGANKYAKQQLVWRGRSISESVSKIQRLDTANTEIINGFFAYLRKNLTGLSTAHWRCLHCQRTDQIVCGGAQMHIKEFILYKLSCIVRTTCRVAYVPSPLNIPPMTHMESRIVWVASPPGVTN